MLIKVRLEERLDLILRPTQDSLPLRENFLHSLMKAETEVTAQAVSRSMLKAVDAKLVRAMG